MDRPVVLSHRTARHLYRSPLRMSVLTDAENFGISEIGIPAREVGRRVQRFLRACGIPGPATETIDILMSMDFMRADSGPFRPHAFGRLLTSQDVHELVPGLCIVREELCFLQAASDMDYLELIEFGYELCGLYETAESEGRGKLARRRALTTTADILAYLEMRAGMNGIKAARRALCRVRDRSRSPMESAMAMMIVLPRKLGGLGYRGIEMNSPIDVPGDVRAITTSQHLEVDIYASRRKVGVEYDGSDHADARQRARDAERLSALAAMGIRVHIVTKRQFAQQLSLHRALNAIARDLKILLDMSPEFQRAQNELRAHFVKRWA